MNKLLLLSVLFSISASAEPCRPGARLTTKFFETHRLSIRFDQKLDYAPDSRLHFVNSDSKSKRYWGTALRVTLNHAEGFSGVPAGQVIPVGQPMHTEGDMNDLFSSELNLLPLESNAFGLQTIQIYSQPYSGVKVRALQKLLGVTLLCD